MYTVIWSALIENSGAPCVERRSTNIITGVAIDGDQAAATVMKWWLEEDDADEPYITNWQSHMGDDETDVTAHVMIHAPAELAGLYEVHAERKITARGYTAENSAVEAMLAGAATSGQETA